MSTKVPVRQTVGFPFTKPPVVSGPHNIVPAGTFTIAHGFGTVPTLIEVTAVCINAEDDFIPGDELTLNPGENNDFNTSHRGLVTLRDATNVSIGVGSSSTPFLHLNKNSKTRASMTPANWRLYVRIIA